MPMIGASSPAPRNGQAAVTFAGEIAGVKAGGVLLGADLLGAGLLDDDEGGGVGLSSGPPQAEAASSRLTEARIAQDLFIEKICS
ncbi:hypothetical protein [Amycolatopsis orientalis]|uniref:hypothetical protein n=1 Tax=Amycolatopsis orientalis TaxID=31958 RepID=UPI0011AB85A6|nr:hypothetical protein [Amycolatopsis orientalis]